MSSLGLKVGDIIFRETEYGIPADHIKITNIEGVTAEYLILDSKDRRGKIYSYRVEALETRIKRGQWKIIAKPSLLSFRRRSEV